MIHLEIEEYCHECPEFEPTKDATYLYENGRVTASDNTVFCYHFSKCSQIARHIKRKLAEEMKNDQG